MRKTLPAESARPTEVLIPDPYAVKGVPSTTIMDYREMRDLRFQMCQTLGITDDDVATVYDHGAGLLTFTLGVDHVACGLGYHQIKRYDGRWLYCCDPDAKGGTCAYLIGAAGDSITDAAAIDQACELVQATEKARRRRESQDDNQSDAGPHCSS